MSQPDHSQNNILRWAREAISTEARAVEGLAGHLDADLQHVVEAILRTQGRVIITGVGKSAAIATKIVATLNSTGTPAIFMHAADAVHGDLGIVQRHDVVICISKSGNTPEIKALVPLLKRGENTLVAMVADRSSYLALQADYILHTPVDKEACPNNLAPTTSTTVQLVMGDVLAICLLNARGFTSEDFARYHPGGALGKKLYLTLGDIALLNEVPQVMPGSAIPEVIMEISRKRLGATAVVEEGVLIGIITDGDIRRMLVSSLHLEDLKAADIMSKDPVRLETDVLAVEGARLMSERKISQLIVTEQGTYKGMVHIHDLNREGILS